MVSSGASTVEEYLSEFSGVDAAELKKIREFCLEHLPAGLEEAMNWGMIVYQVPFATLADTYNGQPLAYAALAKQKHHFSLYLMSIYGDPVLRTKFEAEFRAAGKKLDVGKSCVRFKRMDDLALPAVANALGAVSVKEYVIQYLKARHTK